ncbi:MAG: hypothetical protein H6579_00275 [Chitinophagales bacterium]|nr:hypothetical protein [Chitinophagales bacterium]
MELLLELLKYTLPALVVALVVYIMLRSEKDNKYKLKLLQLKSDNSKEMVPLKLQAYERITLLVHRISPENIIPRLQQPGMSAQQLKLALIQAIQQEFEHNITQQVYVSNGLWTMLVAYKNSFANLINAKSKELEANATAYDLGKLVITEFMENDEILSPIKVQDFIKLEVKSIFI